MNHPTGCRFVALLSSPLNITAQQAKHAKHAKQWLFDVI
jgi:hypothetical protein